jgi:hypothetical protein
MRPAKHGRCRQPVDCLGGTRLGGIANGKRLMILYRVDSRICGFGVSLMAFFDEVVFSEAAESVVFK